MQPATTVSRKDKPTLFREVLGHHPTGVALIAATQADGTPVGMIVGTFTSVSLDPPLVAFVPGKSSTSWPKIREAGAFAVNVLSANQEALSSQFTRSKAADKFSELKWTVSPSGSPILAGCLAWVDCSIQTIHDAGDHEIVIGHVHDLAVASPDSPLVFFRGQFGEYVPKGDCQLQNGTKKEPS